MSGLPLLVSSSGPGATAPTYVDDVFSAYTHTGNGATQTITNGIDLAGKGGLVWVKSRSNAFSHYLHDTARGAGLELSTDTTTPQGSNGYLTAFNSNGFSLAAVNGVNGSALTYSSLTFRKAAKFFDVVTWAGNSTSGRVIPHSLGVTPGMIIVKASSGTGSVNWLVWHAGSGNAFLKLNLTDAASTDNGFVWGNGSVYVAPTSTGFTLNNGVDHNATGVNYVAYIFAHDPTADGLIQCGSFTTDGSGNATVNLGWEPQFLLYKQTSSAGAWLMHDSARGMTSNATTGSAYLFPHLSNAEATQFPCGISATGFSVAGVGLSTTFIYLAIRRSNKPPTTGTQVFNAIARTGTSAAATITGVGFPSDLLFAFRRNTAGVGRLHDKLRGTTGYFSTNVTTAETVAAVTVTSLDIDGATFNTSYPNISGESYINYFFKRAVGVFDQVCWIGDGTTNLRPHGLGVKPELLIMKRRDAVSDFEMAYLGTTEYAMRLNTTAAAASGASNTLSVGTTASVFSATLYNPFFVSGGTYVAYMFATKAGISKVGTYIGNGTTLNIDCGFAAGARFVLIRRTDAVADTYIWDSVRGIVAAADPYVVANGNAAEVTTDDGIDPLSSGFAVNQTAATNINVSAATYIFLAFA